MVVDYSSGKFYSYVYTVGSLKWYNVLTTTKNYGYGLSYSSGRVMIGGDRMYTSFKGKIKVAIYIL